MKRKIMKVVTVLGSALLLCNCAGMNTEFGCNAKANTGCMTISEVNSKAEAGYFDLKKKARPCCQTGVAKSTLSDIWKNNPQHKRDCRSFASSSRDVVRSEERIQRIWIAPYQDLAKNYHEPSYIYTVLEEPHWIGAPDNEIKTTETGQGD